MGINDVLRYREYATNCVQIAQNVADPAAKLALLDMAQVWMMLAERTDRDGGLLPDMVETETLQV
jgi:hypothetical protein